MSRYSMVHVGRVCRLNYWPNWTNKALAHQLGPRPYQSRSNSSSSSSSAGTVKEPFIPAYQPKNQNESIDALKSRLLYQSRKRGMLENDLLLSTFASKYLKSMNEVELKDYDHLINCPSNDWDIYYWATGVKPIPLEFDTPVMKKFVQHVQNKSCEVRLRQPDLDPSFRQEK